MRKAISTSLTAVILSSLSVGARLEAEESLTGHWKAEFQKEEVTRDYFLAIVQEGSELKGSLISARTRAYPFTSASIEGKKLSIDIERRYKSEDDLCAVSPLSAAAESSLPRPFAHVSAPDAFRQIVQDHAPDQ